MLKQNYQKVENSQFQGQELRSKIYFFRRSRAAGKDKTYNKRFQRLESHVVTLARSVAHLSSEMRTQHALIQDIETIK